MEELSKDTPETVSVVDIQFRPGQKIYFFDPAGFTLAQGDHVIMDTARGEEYGICASGIHRIPQKDVVAPLRKVLRKATAQDERIVADNRAKEAKAQAVCIQKIQSHGLDMQLVCAECAFDGSKILFYFTADERVDFRELVKDLASVFHTRIELRQIGVRDKAKMVGGLGICGRPFCCASFLDDFQPVSIKMAKSQNLSLNPTKISGTCGRLMCCLKYEQDTYEALIRTSPKPESFVDTPEGRGTVVEADILRQRVKVRMESNPETVSVFPNEEVAVLRSGKAKKSDPPIPSDLAPISGSGIRPKPERKEEEAMVLEPIRFRYSTESLVEESEEQPQRENTERPQRETGERPQKPKRKPRGPRPEGKEQRDAKEAPRPEAKPQPDTGDRRPDRRRPRTDRPPKENRPAAQEAPQDGEKRTEQKPRRRGNYRNYRKNKGTPGNNQGNSVE
mgnify:CR=1 FL=1